MPYFYDFKASEKSYPASDYSPAFGSVIAGDRMQIALVSKEKGSGSRMHSHPNEQFNYVLQDTFRVKVADQEQMMKPGDLVHIPANAPHYD